MAVAHAALAWQLRSARLGLVDVMALPFEPGDFERVPAARLPERAAGLPHLLMTESTLSGRAVSVVIGEPGDAVRDRGPDLGGGQVDALTAIHLRMCILLRSLDPVTTRCAAATATVQCFWQFSSDPRMRQ